MKNDNIYNLLLTFLAVLFVAMVSFSIATAQSGQAFRTFQASELTVKSPVSAKAEGMKWEFQFVNNTGVAVQGLHVEFYAPLVHLTNFAPFSVSRGSLYQNGVQYTFTGASVAAGSQIVIDGYTSSPLPAILNAYWVNAQGLAVGANMGVVTPVSQEPYILMPNTANVREAVYASQSAKTSVPVVIGIPQPHGYPGAWVTLKTSKNFLRSMVDGGLTHAGTPHGLDRNDRGLPIVGEQTYLSPAVANNVLFAQLVALKLNLRMSDEGISPKGFGDLAYFVEGQPFRGMLIRDIANKADSMMTYCWNYSATDYSNISTLVAKINRAFDGPIDTVSFVQHLQLTGLAGEAVGTFLFAPEMAFPQTHAAVVTPAQPAQFHLNQNYPNPFNPTTTISFTVDAPAVVTLKVYNELGQEVATLMNRAGLGAGQASVHFNGNNLASGTYMYRVTSEYTSGNRAPVTEVRKMMLVK